MRKFFGEYLVEKGLIRAEDLVRALLKQLREVRQPAIVAFEKGILSSSELLDIFRTIEVEGKNFFSAAQQVPEWKSSKEPALKRELDRDRVPVGKLLVEAGVLELAALNKALESFLADCEPRKAEQGDHGDQPRLASAPSAAILDDIRRSDVAMVLSDSMLRELREIIERWARGESNEQLQEARAHLDRLLQVARGFAQINRLGATDEVVTRMLQWVADAPTHSPPPVEIQASMLGGIGVIQLIRDALVAGRSEVLAWSDPALQEKWKQIQQQMGGVAA